MQIVENSLIKEKVYIEKLDNGLTIMCIPKNGILKKYIICGINYGSVDNKFEIVGENEQVVVPDGVAHFLEHKMFEQEDGPNSLDVLSSLGVEANAYTTNNHTAYLYECTDNFYEALEEFMDYIQHPYFTDENVEKEKGIIEQEINMYDDTPDWKVYINALDALYKNNQVKIDITGSVQSVRAINKDILYKCYNTFYTPSNMAIVVCGDFNPEEIINTIKQKVVKQDNGLKIKKIYEEEPKEINKKFVEEKMDINMPLFIIGYKDTDTTENKVKRHLAIQILLEIIIGNSSNLYKDLYEQGLIFSDINISYEFARDYAHVLIQGQSLQYNEVIEKITNKIEEYKQNGIDQNDFERIKKKIYGMYVRDFEDVESTANAFLDSYFKDISPFDYIEEYNTITKDYVKQILKELFVENNKILSIITPKE